MEQLTGKFEFLDSNGLERYLIGLGVGLVFRKVANVSKPSLSLMQEGEGTWNRWTFRLSSIFHTHALTFKLNETVDDETFDARRCKTTVSYDKKKKSLIMKQVCEEGPNVKLTIEKTNKIYITLTYVADKYTCSMTFRPSSIEETLLAKQN